MKKVDTKELRMVDAGKFYGFEGNDYEIGFYIDGIKDIMFIFFIEPINLYLQIGLNEGNFVRSLQIPTLLSLFSEDDD